MEGTARQAFVEQACGDDIALREEVLSLLKHDSSNALFADLPDFASPTSHTEVGEHKPTRSSFSTHSVITTIAHGLQRRWVQSIVLVAIIGFLTVIGFAVYRLVERSIHDIVANKLEGIRNTTELSLDAWVEERKADGIDRVIDLQLRQHVQSLVAIGQAENNNPAKLLSAPAAQALGEILRPHREFYGYGVVNREGVVIAGDVSNVIGAHIEGSMHTYTMDVLEGKTRFIPPTPWDEIIREDSLWNKHPYIFVVAPVRGEGDYSIASLWLEVRPWLHFSDILEAAHLGETGETYLFDKQGFMLSKSRFYEQMVAQGLAESDAVAQGFVYIPLRDPGDEQTQGRETETDQELRPWTRIVARAIARSAGTNATTNEGLILEPYRNYRGAEVVGAWAWLPHLEIGLATEIEVSEAFIPLRYLKVTALLLFTLLVLAMVGLLIASLVLARIRVQEGQRVGAYTLVKKIGEGGLGEVFLAKHSLLKRPSAIKFLKPENHNRATIRRFEREVQAASQLRHPNTIDIFDFGRTHEGVFYYAMEYIPGLSLQELVLSEGALPPGRVVYMLKQMAASLNEAHLARLIHRDVKPSNIMVFNRTDTYDVVKVLDFGLVKDLEHVHTRTNPTQISGTLLYMAPERIRTPYLVDERVDIYSLGAVGYFLLSGRPLFALHHDMDILYKVLNEEPASLPAHVPQDLAHLVMGCLAKEPANRPQTVQDLLALLDVLDAVVPWTQEEAAAFWEAQSSEAV